jgi:hypothetical protein
VAVDIGGREIVGGRRIQMKLSAREETVAVGIGGRGILSEGI